MKKFLLFAYCAILVGALASCGGSSDKESDETQEEVGFQSYVLTPSTASITGPMGKAYEVVERDYKVKQNYGVPEINVEITLVDPKGLPAGFNPTKVGTRYDKGEAQYPMLANFTIEFLDEDGDIIESHEPNSSYSDLLRLSQGETSTLRFYAPDTNTDEVKYFRIKSDYFPNEIEETATESYSSADISPIDDEELSKTLEQAGKVAETAGKMVETAGEVLKGLNSLTQ